MFTQSFLLVTMTTSLISYYMITFPARYYLILRWLPFQLLVTLVLVTFRRRWRLALSPWHVHWNNNSSSPSFLHHVGTWTTHRRVIWSVTSIVHSTIQTVQYTLYTPYVNLCIFAGLIFNEWSDCEWCVHSVFQQHLQLY